MIRRSAQKAVGNPVYAYRLWKVVASGFRQSSSANGELQQQSWGSASSGFEDSLSLREFGILKGTVSIPHATPCGPEGSAQSFPRKNGLGEKWWWTEIKPSSPGVESQCRFHSPSGWSGKLGGRSPHQSSSLLEFWSRSGLVRSMSTKPIEGGGASSEAEKAQTTEEVPSRPKSIEDFQHEEIVGPTVERDESDTAHQLRASLNQLTTFMTSLRTGFVLLGSVQLLAAVWNLYFHGAGLFPGLLQDSAFVMSFLLAYLLRLFGSRVEFFQKIEERSRMRILTLSLQANRMLTTFFFRSSFVVKAVAGCSLLALVGDVWLFHSGTL